MWGFVGTHTKTEFRLEIGDGMCGNSFVLEKIAFGVSLFARSPSI
ncbi:hypothetical protein LEP1GSC052_2591 [Leptospira kmetyi serovar Malaysia str. Bejo-Iso9]|nr:hypothetical protein LEP1GSC052_2591 [Leptospira kmetyi serovar Malaysia str. Bejo-Iso9]